jgi:hypothetical protein
MWPGYFDAVRQNDAVMDGEGRGRAMRSGKFWILFLGRFLRPIGINPPGRYFCRGWFFRIGIRFASVS